jgi:hypothetical protein
MTLPIIQKRFLLFLLGCIPARFIIAFLAKSYPEYLPYFGLISFIIGMGFLIIYVGDYRKTAAEVFGDKIWWNKWRPLHALLFLAFAYFAFNNNKDAWKLLLVDAVIGLYLFTNYHFNVMK